MTPADDATTEPLRRIVMRPLVAGVLLTLALVLFALTLPGRAALAAHWYLVGIGAIAVATLLRLVTARYPVLWQSPYDTAGPGAVADEAPARLRAIERVMARAQWDPAGSETELRPLLRAIAARRLATSRTIDLERDPESARAALGERVWQVLYPAVLGTGPGQRVVDRDDLRATVERLEELGVDPHP